MMTEDNIQFNLVQAMRKPRIQTNCKMHICNQVCLEESLNSMFFYYSFCITNCWESFYLQSSSPRISFESRNSAEMKMTAAEEDSSASSATSLRCRGLGDSGEGE